MEFRDLIISKITEYAIGNSLALFLEMEGEFYPYGIIIDSDQSIVPFYVVKENDFPDPENLIIDLKKELNEYVLNQNCLSVALCYLASKKVNDLEYDLLVLEIIFKDQSALEEFWFIIEIDNENHTFKVHAKIDLKI